MRGLLTLLASLPLPVARVLGNLVGFLNFHFNSRAAKVTRENLALCLPDMSDVERTRLTAESLRHTGQTMLETPAVWLGDRQRVASWIRRIEQENLLDAAIANGQGVVVILPHLGNWELFNNYFAQRGTMTALYHPPRQAWLKPIMETIRQRHGNRLVPTTVKGIATLFRALEQKQVVIILPDQVPASGEFAPFFGQPALTDKLAVRLIQKTGAKAVCANVWRESSGFVVTFSEPDDAIYDPVIGVALAGLNRSIEACVMRHPAQYQWEYKRFRERPAGMMKLYNVKGHPDYYH